ncbi:MAG TPA: 23S rRNA (uracil(1939)-C(5))-methyltransferase RlmD, partial [Armatimonadota bacterium]|nr:23S rRNA (uracil(1939)-C(5))-methyltransferase RlmD [Armatimonadota bacterium]
MSIDQSDPYHPRVGDRLAVTIEALASGGDGIAREAGFTLFIPRTAPGDVVDVEVTEVAKSFGRAKILSIVRPGPDRVPTTCPLAEGCAGCQLQHLRYSAQLTAKQGFVRDALERIGHFRGIDVRPTVGMDDPWHYRNKGEFIADIQKGQVRLGYHAEGGGGFVPLPDCPIQHPISMRIVRALETIATEKQLPLAQLITRVSPSENTALAILVCWEWHDALPAAAEALQQLVPELAGVLWSRVRGRSVVRRTLAEPLIGAEKLTQRLASWTYTVSAESFFQVNSTQAVRLIEFAEEYAGNLTEADFADGYCGVGTFLLPLGSRAHSSIGIEEHPVALHDAEENVEQAGIRHVRLYEARVDTIVTRLQRKGRTLDVAVLDPPRKGAGRVVLESLAGLGVNRIVLVSCDPATLGRDAGDLRELGYRLSSVQPVDMFPQ